MAERSLQGVAAELYAGDPRDFVVRRDELAATTSDGDLARGIRSLRKPSIAAWVVNVLARERSELLAQALTLAGELRRAQADLDATELAQLGRERRALTLRLTDDAVALAAARGERVSGSTREAVRQTLSAAFFDAGAAAAVASGRLLREIEAEAAFPIDPDTVVAGGRPSADAAPEQPADELAARRERRDAERQVRNAEQELTRAEHARTRTERAHDEAVERVQELTSQVSDLETELEDLRRRAESAQAAVTDAARAADVADARVASARDAVQRARRTLT